MTDQEPVPSELAALKNLLGPPAVLSTESAAAYEELWMKLVEALKPRDFLEQLFVQQYAECVWEIRRHMRTKTSAVERKLRQRLEFQAQRTKLAAQKKQAREREEKAGAAANAFESLCEVEDVVECTVQDVDEILDRKANELDHACAFESAIELLERLDRLHNAARLRLNDSLQQLELYRNGLGQHAREVTGKIIDGECRHVDPKLEPDGAPLAPTE
jgi:hypothetical protein